MKTLTKILKSPSLWEGFRMGCIAFCLVAFVVNANAQKGEEKLNIQKELTDTNNAILKIKEKSVSIPAENNTETNKETVKPITNNDLLKEQPEMEQPQIDKIKTINENNQKNKQVMIGDNGEEILFLADPNYVPQKTDVYPAKPKGINNNNPNENNNE